MAVGKLLLELYVALLQPDLLLQVLRVLRCQVPLELEVAHALLQLQADAVPSGHPGGLACVVDANDLGQILRKDDEVLQGVPVSRLQAVGQLAGGHGHVRPGRGADDLPARLGRRRLNLGIDARQQRGIGCKVEVLSGERRPAGAKARSQGGVLENPGAAVGDVGGGPGLEEDGLDAVLHPDGNVGRGQHHRAPGGQELGQLRRKPVVIEGPGLPRLDEDVRRREEPRQAHLGDEAQVAHVRL